jgi:hypothetical protein
MFRRGVDHSAGSGLEESRDGDLGVAPDSGFATADDHHRLVVEKADSQTGAGRVRFIETDAGVAVWRRRNAPNGARSRRRVP